MNKIVNRLKFGQHLSVITLRIHHWLWIWARWNWLCVRRKLTTVYYFRHCL